MNQTNKFRQSWLVVIVLSGALLAAAQSLQSVEELSQSLLSANSDQAREALLDAHQQLATIKLAETLNAKGNELISTNNYTVAITAFSLARRIAERYQDAPQLIAALNGSGDAHQARTELKSALELYQQALKIG